MPAHHQAVFAPVELERLAQLEGQRHEGGGRNRLARAEPPLANEVGQPRVAALVALGLDLRVQRSRGAPLVARPVRIGLERLHQRLVKRAQLLGLLAAPVLRLAPQRPVQPFGNRVARQPRDARDLALRLLAPAIHPPDPANHIQVITPSFPCCLRKQQGRWNTRLSFDSAYPSEVAQFSVGANIRSSDSRDWLVL